MIKQIYVNGNFHKLMDDDNTNDEQELAEVKAQFPGAEVVILESLDGSNQHVPEIPYIMNLETEPGMQMQMATLPPIQN